MNKSTLLAATAIRSLSAVGLVLACATPALAQTVKEDKAPASTLTTEQEIKSGQKAVSASGPTTTTEVASPTGEIVVTGSRIRRPNLASALPVTSISGQEFFETGNVSIGDTLNDLPSLRSTFGQANSTRFLGTSGLNLLDLRGLGTARTLVLINGRRQVGGDILNSGVSVDTNTIPTDLIDRVDIVTGGSSAVYGSDAIAGVVNFVLKDHFQGVQMRAQAGISKYHDAGGYFISGLVGQNFSGGRGNVALNVEYARQDSYTAAKRPFINNQSGFIFVDSNNTNGIPNNKFYSNILSGSYSNFGLLRFGGVNTATGQNQPLNCGFDPAGAGYNCPFTFTPTGDLVPVTGQRVGFGPTGSFIGGNGINFNLSPPAQLSPQLDRVNVNLLGHFEISPAFVPFVEAKYSRTRTVGYGSNGPAFINGGVLGDRREQIRFDSPYLSDQARGVIAAERALNGQSAPVGSTRLNVRENLLGLGARTEDAIRQTYRIVGGVKGDFGSNLNYEVAVNYSRLNEKTKLKGNLNVQRFLLANDAVRDPASGNIVCRSAISPAAAIGYASTGNDAQDAAILAADVAACTPINIVGGQFTDAQRAYVLQDTIATGRASQFDATGFIAGDTGKFFNLPGGPVGFVLGAEHRSDSVYYNQDPLVSNGYTFYNAIPTFKAPKNKVTEAFGEVRFPLVKDVPGFKLLEIDAAGRVSHYTLAKTGTVKAYNITGLWSPTSDIRFRANYARAVRAPNQVELFTPAGQNFSLVNDPCASTNIAQGSSFRQANCAALGIPSSYNFQYSGSLAFQSAGNLALAAEKSDSYTVGGVFTPRFIPGLSVSVDYYTIKVKNTISGPSAQAVINACVDLQSINNVYCSLFQRAGAGGGPNGEEPFRIIENSLLITPRNYAKLTAQGIDTEIAYRHQISNLGRLDTRFTYTHTTARNDFIDANNPTFANRVRSGLGDPVDAFNWKSSLEHGRFTFGYQLRFIGKQTVFAPSTVYAVQGRPATNPEVSDPLFYPTRWYHDVRLGIDATKRFNFYMGVDNLTNAKPPLGLSGIGGGSGIYDARGRYYYTGIVAKF